MALMILLRVAKMPGNTHPGSNPQSYKHHTCKQNTFHEGSVDPLILSFKHQQHLQSPNYGTAVKERKQTES